MAGWFTRREVLGQLAGVTGGSALVIGSTVAAHAQSVDPALEELARVLSANSSGQIVRPGQPGHNKIKYYNGRFDCVRSTTYLRPSSVDGVKAILGWANRHRRTLAIRGGGHSFEGKSSHPDLVIDMSQMTKMTFSSEGILEVEAGVRLGDIYNTIAPKGFVLPAGTCPTVGVVGHALGGGIGDFLPMFGYAAQSLASVTLVTMAGTVLRVDDQAIEVLGGAALPNSDLKAPELMKIIRGGGQGTIGVACKMTFRAHDVRGAKLSSFRVETDGDVSRQRSVAILKAWHDWRTALPLSMQSMVSSKVDLSRSGNGCSFAIAGLIVVPPGSSVGIADIRRTLEPLLGMRELRRTDNFFQTLNVVSAIKTFLDDDETTRNPKRKMLYGSSSALPAALPKRAIEYLINNLKPDINASFYTSGGKSRAAPATSLHQSEFIIEWSTYSPRRDAKAAGRIRTLNAAVMKEAEFADHAFPNYPDDAARDYYPNKAEIAALKALLDPTSVSTSSLLTQPPVFLPLGQCG